MAEPQIAPETAPHAGASGSLTFLFTDVEGSTRLWEQSPDAMRTALGRHDELLRSAIEASGGKVVKTTGDGLMAVFASASAGIRAAVGAQLAIEQEPWPEPCLIRVRMGLHSGEAEVRGGDYFGRSVNRAARIMAAGHGGQVLLSSSTAALAADGLGDATGLRDLGEHRLKDLDRPERLFQLLHPGLATDFATLGTVDLRATNLPAQASAFVGREAELEAIRTRLADGGVRLLTLTGPGGSGKTRLALRAAADQLDRFADGVFFVDLSSARDADALVALMAGAIGLGDTPDRAPLDELKARLRTQRVLLVLDNFEQIAAAASVAVELLEGSPELKLLVTSREALRVRGEHLLTVPPMTLPTEDGGRTTAAELGRFEAIQLFVARARAVNPGFNLTDENAAAVADICRRLDGLPLAIELATARLNLFTPEALLGRLERRLAVLRGGARDLPLRQQTMRATVEWSYQLLEPGDQRLLELLSVFAGARPDLVEEVVEQVGAAAAPVADTFDGLTSLLAKSLLRQADGADGAEPRFIMLETIREYAGEQLDARPEVAAAVRAAHARVFAEAAAHTTHADVEIEAEAGADALVAELENLRIAWRHWVATRDAARLDQLENVLWAAYEQRGWYHATVELIRDHLDVLGDTPASPERWEQQLTLLTSLARALLLLRGYSVEVEDAYHRAIALFEHPPEGASRRQFPVLRGLSSFYGFRGEFVKGIEIIHEILRLADEEGDTSVRIDGTILLGGYSSFLGQIREGLDHIDGALAAAEGGGYRSRRMRLGNDLRVSGYASSAFLAWLLGRPDDAQRRADRGVELARELDHPYSIAYALYHNGFLRHWRREPELVRARALDVLATAEANELSIWRALGSILLGAASAALGDPDAGREHVAAGLVQYQGLRTPPVFWPLVRYLEAGVLLAAHDPLGALPRIDEAAELAGPQDMLAPLLQLLRSDVLLVLPVPDVDGAREAVDRAVSVATLLGTPGTALPAATRRLRLARPGEVEARRDELRAVLESLPEGRDSVDAREAEAALAS